MQSTSPEPALPLYSITPSRWNGQTMVAQPIVRYVRALTATDALDRFLKMAHGTTFNVTGGSFQGTEAHCPIPGGHRFDWYRAETVDTDTGMVHGPMTAKQYALAVRAKRDRAIAARHASADERAQWAGQERARYSPALVGRTGTTQHGERVKATGPAMDPARVSVLPLGDEWSGCITWTPRVADVQWDAPHHGQDYVSVEGDTFAGEPLPIGTLVKWDGAAQTHYPAGPADSAQGQDIYRHIDGTTERVVGIDQDGMSLMDQGSSRGLSFEDIEGSSDRRSFECNPDMGHGSGVNL